MAQPVPVIRDLTIDVVVERGPCASGGFGDIFRGSMSGTSVAIKTLRIDFTKESERKKANKRLAQELQVWSSLDHPNVLKLLGKISSPISGKVDSMVCPWMEKGDLYQLQRSNPFMSQGMRFQILSDVANGLEYLHQENIVHGDLSGGNILFDSKGTAQLSDFGLAKMVQQTSKSTKKTGVQGGTIYYRPPENFFNATLPRKPLKASDIYSFGSIIYQVLTGRLPYYELRGSMHLELYITRDGKWKWPKRHPYIKEDHWKLMSRCWNTKPPLRPLASSLVKSLNQFLLEIGDDSLNPDHIPSLPKYTFSSMILFNLPRDATHLDLVRFIHNHHSNSDSTDPATARFPDCTLCPNFVFISTRRTAWAIFDKEDAQSGDRAVLDCSKQKWAPGQKGSPSIVCRAPTVGDEYGKGSAMWVKWKLNSDVNHSSESAARPLVVPNVIPFMDSRAFIMRCARENLQTLHESVTTETWASEVQFAALLNTAFTSSSKIYLVFVVGESKKAGAKKNTTHGNSRVDLFGVASIDGPAIRPASKEVTLWKFKIKWLKTHGGPLKPLLGDNLQQWGDILKVRDGTEIPSSIVDTLLSRWPALPAEHKQGDFAIFERGTVDESPLEEFEVGEQLESELYQDDESYMENDVEEYDDLYMDEEDDYQDEEGDYWDEE